MSYGDRLVAAGGTLAGLGGALGVGYFIYTLQASVSFWLWPGWAAVITTVVGLIALTVGLFKRDKGANGLHQRQRGGDASTNYQAGRDLTIERGDNGDR